MLCYAQAKPLGEGGQRDRFIGDEQQELLAAPADQVALPCQQGLAELHQTDEDLIAHPVAETVVDLFEVIAVKHDGADALAACQGLAVFEGIEVVAVEGAGQGIVARQVVEAPVEALGTQAGDGRHHQTENGDERRRRLPQQRLQ